jgi:hypothetical protein
MLYIRLHIRKGADQASSSQLMFHLIANHEMIYSSSVRDSKYHTRGLIAHPDIVKSAVAVQRENDNPGALTM